jgi:hypothetical protein
MPTTDRICHKLAAAVFMAVLSTSAIGGHPLEDAAYEASNLCAEIDGVTTLDECMRTTSPSPHRAPAKAALLRMLKAREAFMKECDTERGTLRKCQEQADLYIFTGPLRDFKWTVEYLDRVPPSARR